MSKGFDSANITLLAENVHPLPAFLITAPYNGITFEIQNYIVNLLLRTN